MKKIDFAIHLFATARTIGSTHPQRVPVVTLLMLLILSKNPDEWVSGSKLAAPILGLSSNTLASATKSAIAAGLMERRELKGGVNGALEWKLTAAGQRMAAQLLDTAAAAATA